MANIVTGYSYIPKNLAPRAFAIGRPQNTEWARLNRSFNDDFERVRDSVADEFPIYLKGSLVESFFRLFGPQPAGYTSFIRAEVLIERSLYVNGHSPAEEAEEPLDAAMYSTKLHAISNSLPFESPNIAFVNRRSLPDGKLGRNLPFMNASIISNEIVHDKYDFLKVSVHEMLHGNSFGFAPSPLDEGACSFFEKEVAEHPLFSVFYPELMGRYRMLSTLGYGSGYQIETLAIERLVEVAGRPAVFDAFFRGDESGLLTKLGTQKWRSIKDLAFSYHSRDVDMRYLELFSKILQIPITGRPNRSGRIIV